MKVPPAHSQAQTTAATLAKDKMALALGHRGRSWPFSPPTLEHPVQQRGWGVHLHPFISRPASLAEVGAGAVGGGHCGRKSQNQI